MLLTKPAAQTTIDGRMDATSDTDSVSCPACGYSRRGLPGAARCPECGALPPEPLATLIPAAGAARHRADQAWLAAVAVGLLLLLVSSFYALQVTLILNLGGLALTAVNVPGPKLWASAALLREIGVPGTSGVTGILAVLGNVLGFWFITEPRVSDALSEGLVSLRRCTRWVCVITCGALLGDLFGGSEIAARSWGWSALPSLSIALLAVEAPANTLLYFYLARLAMRFEINGRPVRGLALFEVVKFALPVAVVGGALMSIVRGALQDQPVLPWRCAQALYGAAALGIGACMTVSVLHLTGRVILAALDQSLASLLGRFFRLRRPMHRMISALRADPPRWAAVAGLSIWLWNSRPLLGIAALIDHRRGLGGDWPVINFIGPKIWAVPLLDRTLYGGPDARVAIISTIIAVWMIASYRPPPVSSRRALLLRWTPTVLMGLALGLAMATDQVRDRNPRESYWAAGAVIGVEAPSTLVLYSYLSGVASALNLRRLARQLHWMGCAALGLILLPCTFYLLSVPLSAYRNGTAVLAITVAYGALVVAAGVAAWALVLKLTWELARRREPRSIQRSAVATVES